MRIAAAAPTHLPEIQAIYAHHVLTGTGTFEEVPPPLELVERGYREGRAAGHDWLVAEDASQVLGFCYAGPFRARSAYRFTEEDSVYVRDDVRGQGVGRALLAQLLLLAEARGVRRMLALIGDSENAGSIGMHASLGFAQVGVLRGCGLKFGRWLDVVIMQRSLGTPAD